MYRTDPGKVIIASVELFSCPSELNPMHVGITFMYIEHNKACLCFRRVNRKCTVEEDETCYCGCKRRAVICGDKNGSEK